MKDPLKFQLTINKKQFILKIDLDCHMKFVALTVILMLISAVVGFTTGNLQTNKGYTTQSNNPIQNAINKTTQTTSLFESQTATITGSVTAKNDKSLTITNTKNEPGQFLASDQIIVVDMAAKTNPAAPGNIDAVTLNKPALIQLQMEAGEYKVLSISYLPENTPPAPAASPPAR